MRVVVNPTWTFRDALDAAWNAYSGGRQFGVPNRTRVLQQWANVVGRERATHDLEATLAAFPNLDAASDELGLSRYTIRMLRKSFANMPELTPFSQETEPPNLYALLKDLPNHISPANELAFISYLGPRLSRILGYPESATVYEPALGGNRVLRPDLMLGARVVVEVKQDSLSDSRRSAAEQQVTTYMNAASAQLGVVITPFELGLATDGRWRWYELPDITPEQAEEIADTLSSVPGASESTRPPLAQPATTSLDHLLSEIAGAQTNDEKKNSLERFAAAAIEAHPFLRCKYKNLRTSSSEIDLVCEYSGSEPDSFLNEYGRYLLVECKNWSKPVGAKEIRDFIGKLRSTRIKLGVFFSRSGITGEANGTDALMEIRSAFDRGEATVAVISGNDLEGLDEVKHVLRIVDERIDAVRFKL